MSKTPLRERIIRRLFPCARLEPPDTGKVVTNLAVVARLSIADRLRLAVSGRCEVYTRAVVENGVATSTTHRFAVLPPESWGADPPPPRFPASVPLSADSACAIPVCLPAPEQARRWVWGHSGSIAMVRGVHATEAEAVAAAIRHAALRGPMARAFVAPVPDSGALPHKLVDWDGHRLLSLPGSR